MILILSLLACVPGGAELDASPPGSDAETGASTETGGVPPTAAARDALEEAGFVVQDGVLHFATYEGCCDPGAKCLGNNPSTPYGSYALPPAPGDPGHPEDIFAPWGPLPDPSLSRLFRMRADEALVWIGTVPPEAKYLGIRSYLITSVTDSGTFTIPMGAVGPSLNQLVIAEERQLPVDAIWGEPLVVITTLDAAVERQVEGLLVEAGFDPATVHHDRIPPELVEPGLHADADTFHVSIRVAVDADPAAGAAYRADPGATVLRLTPAGAETVAEPHPVQPLPAKGTGSGEEELAGALLELGQAVLARHGAADLVRADGISPRRETDSIACLSAPTGCVGEIRDRFTAVGPEFVLPGDGGYAVVFGVNHERTGKASYSNFAVVSDIHGIGIDGIDSRDMIGTARTYLPDHPRVDDLYAAVVARDCSGFDEICLEIPYTCPGALSLEPLQVTIRAYLEPTTGAAPVADELLPDQLWLFNAD